MKKFNDMKIAARLAIAFATITLLIATLGYQAHDGFSTISTEWHRFALVSLEKRESAARGMVKLGDAVHHFKNYVLRGGDYDRKFMTDLDEIEALAAGFGKGTPLVAEERAFLSDIRKGTASYRDAMKKAREMKASGAGIEEIDKSIAGADKMIGTAFAGLLATTKKEIMATEEAITAEVEEGDRWVIILNAVAILLAGLCAWFVSRSITRPLNQAVHIARTVASGDLTSRIEIRNKDECGMLLQALKDMNDNLVRIVHEVRSGTDTIATASQQIAVGSQDLSTRTEEQASSLEEASSSMQELTANVRRNAENAFEADEAARSASDVARKAGSVMKDMLETMSSIDSSSKKIVEIISVIDGIAFQTNILALNAAVEAARAGEQGRGFSVVAAEVRGLAQRCAAAAKEIKALIDNSVNTVESGAALANQAGATMEEVVAGIRQVTGLIGTMSKASAEESSGIDQISQTVMQIDQITQQNAALVEETATASDSLQQQAARLAEMVSVFKLDGGQVAGSRLAQVRQAETSQEALAGAQRLAHSSRRQAAAAQYGAARPRLAYR